MGDDERKSGLFTYRLRQVTFKRAYMMTRNPQGAANRQVFRTVDNTLHDTCRMTTVCDFSEVGSRGAVVLASRLEPAPCATDRDLPRVLRYDVQSTVSPTPRWMGLKPIPARNATCWSCNEHSNLDDTQHNLYWDSNHELSGLPIRQGEYAHLYPPRNRAVRV